MVIKEWKHGRIFSQCNQNLHLPSTASIDLQSLYAEHHLLQMGKQVQFSEMTLTVEISEYSQVTITTQ